MRVTFLPDVLHDAGLVVQELTGWAGRGVPLMRVDAVICHATITGRHVPDVNVAGILRDGCKDLPGPLCQLGLDRGGRWWVVADGKGNHNGHGLYANQTIGVEAFNDGTEPWPAIQLDSYQRGVAAICRRLDLPVERVLAHRESDPGRKSDPSGIDMDAFRRRVAHHLTPQEPDDMPWTDEDSANLAAVKTLLEQMNHHISAGADKGGRLARITAAVEALVKK